MIPIYADTNVGPKFYTRADALLVRHTFFTIQSEGPFCGRPAFFIRLGGCNLGDKSKYCSFCDSDFRAEHSTYQTYQELLDKILEVRAPLEYDPLIVITGGEPFLQAIQLQRFVRHLHENLDWVEIQFESNGTMFSHIRSLLAQAVYNSVSVVVSPKAAMTDDGLHFTGDPGASFTDAEESDSASEETWFIADNLYYKFVVSADPTSKHNQLPAWVDRIPPEKVYISAIAEYRRELKPGETANLWDATLIDQASTSKNYQYAAELAMEKGFNLSVQSHLLCSIE
jgi:organic radical activating enzyme